MTKVYPNGWSTAREGVRSKASEDGVVLTVWKKSLLMNCDGFTVFDSRGNLVFRVDNYMAGSKAEIVLMDASGKSLLTIRRRKRLSLRDDWLVFEGETTVNPRYSVSKQASLMNIYSSKSVLAHVTDAEGPKNINNKSKVVAYQIEGSYQQRCCSIYDGNRRQVAEIKRKEAVRGVVFGIDVFRLLVLRPHEIELPVAMALVILLDQMFGSSSSSSRLPYIRSLSSC